MPGPYLGVFAAGDQHLAGEDLGIDLNALPAAAGPFRVAFTTATGLAPPYTVWLGTRPR